MYLKCEIRALRPLASREPDRQSPCHKIGGSRSGHPNKRLSTCLKHLACMGHCTKKL